MLYATKFYLVPSCVDFSHRSVSAEASHGGAEDTQHVDVAADADTLRRTVKKNVKQSDESGYEVDKSTNKAREYE